MVGSGANAVRSIMLSAALAVAVCTPAHAEAPNDPVEAAVETFARGLVREDDVGLAFDYLREALAAAVEGREVPVPEKLARRAQVIGETAKQRGAALGRVLLDALELSIRGIIAEPSGSGASTALPGPATPHFLY